MVLRSRACLGWLALFGALVPGAASAQHITVDGTLSRARTLPGPHYQIGAGLGRQVGGNLFQSFGIFGLTPGESATFKGPASVANIIGRVTGGQISSIDGKINSQITGANVYLINPYGVVFGPQGTVNVSGSFYASTANYIKMANGARFRATHPKASTLTAAPPAAFGFLDAKPPAITVNGSLLEARGTIGLVGGPVSIRKAKIAPAGAIDVASVAGEGEVPVNPRNAQGLTAKRFGRVTITGGSTLDVGNPGGHGHAGSVFIRSGSLTIDDSTIEADNHGARTGGEIVLEAGGRIALGDGAAVETVDFGRGRGGRLSVSTGRLVLTDGAALATIAEGIGAAGPVDVAAGAILIDGRGDPSSATSLGSVTLAKGQAGAVTISAGSLSIFANGEVIGVTFGRGGGGNLALDVRGALSIDATGAAQVTGVIADAETGSTGSAGDVAIVAGSLKTVDGGEISSGADGSGDAGDVTVRVAGAALISGAGTGIEGNTFGTGHGGIITVRTGALFLEDGAQISVSSVSTGAAGEVSVEVANNLTIKGSSGIFSNALAANSKAAGTITVAAGSLSIENGGEISAGTWGSGKGGDISVDVSGRLTITGAAGLFTGIAAQANLGSSGSAGAVGVTAGTLVVVDGGEISSATFGTKNGGTVTVSAGALRVAAAGEITADSEAGSKGDAGKVMVAAGSLDIHDGLISSGLLAAFNGLPASMGKHAGTVIVEVSGLLTIDGAGSASLRGIAADANTGTTGTGGDVRVTAGTLSITDKGEIASSTFGAGRGGSVSVAVAGRLEIDGASSRALGLTGITSEANPGSSGGAGDVFVRAGSLSILDNGEISSAAFGTENAGTVSVTARAISLASGGEIASSSEAGSSGDAGNVIIKAGSLGINDGLISSGLLAAFNGVPASAGRRAGNITVEVSGLLTIVGSGSAALAGIATDADPGTTGNAGNVHVTAAALSIVDNGEIASGTFGAGTGGNVFVAVSGRLKIDGARSNPKYVTGIATQANRGSTNNAGDVLVRTGSLSLLDGGGIESAAIGGQNREPASTGSAGKIVVSVTGQLLIEGAGSEIATTADPGTIGNAGSLEVRAGQISIADGGEVVSTSAGTGAGGSVTVATRGTLLLDGGGVPGTEIAASATGPQSGPAGTVAVTARSLTIEGGAEIASTTAGPGTGGDVILDVSSDIVLAGPGPQITAQSTGSGDAGNISVTAGTMAVTAGGAILSTTAGSGAGGSVTVATRGTLLLDGDGVPGTEIAASATGPQSGPAGTVAVTARSLTIEGGAEIASTTAGPGTGGDVILDVSSDVVLAGPGPQITAQSTGSGVAGNISVTAGTMAVTDGAAIVSTSAGTGAGGSVTVATRGTLLLDGGGVPGTEIAASATGLQSGPAGTVAVTARSLTIEGGAEIASTTAGPGTGGDVILDVSSDIVLAGPGPQITAQSTGGGDAGAIAIAAERLLLNGGAAISTEAATSTANGGNIGMSLREMLYLIDGEITTSVKGETGNGGNITIASPFVILSGSDVIAQAVEGHGGNITIDAGQYIPSTDSTVSASSAFGVSGNVVISGPRVDLNGTLVVLSSELLSAVAVTRASCAAHALGRQSSLVEAGRGGLPEDPNASLPALYLAGRDLRLDPRVAPRRAEAGGDLPSTLESRLRCG